MKQKLWLPCVIIGNSKECELSTFLGLKDPEWNFFNSLSSRALLSYKPLPCRKNVYLSFDVPSMARIQYDFLYSVETFREAIKLLKFQYRAANYARPIYSEGRPCCGGPADFRPTCFKINFLMNNV